MPFTNDNPFEEPKDETIIWRYMDISKFLSLLQKQSLFFSCANRLGDKYEMSLVDDITPADIDHQISDIRDKARVNCWNISDHEEDLMWRKYIKTNSLGIAIESNYRNLKDSFSKSDQVIASGIVKYSQHLDMSTLKEGEMKDDMINIMLHKKRLYKGENELRFFVYPLGSDTSNNVVIESNGDINIIGENVKIDLEKLIYRIYTSPEAPKYFIDSIIKLLRNQGFYKEVIPSEINF